ncbi:hypothetical protein OA93_20205 [Flavobacterium sp. KMS]|uniref:hypothetical protein n=1 Tax=Flavobacterium sp. KMS TaxID=1566023 RepID=UPI00057D2731|nr:hypothetical protein [Flavobacterium sp. KMS]KIA94457.1 hypothetical protein OA93_20205 [Flavobacterium sp. KMS]
MKISHAFYIAIILFSFLFTSCTEKNSDDPNEVYELWSFREPEKDIKITNGQYWQSAHFTREYEMYLELYASPEWLDEFIKINNLKVHTSQIYLPDDAPSWFKPKIGLIAFSSPNNLTSIYFIDFKKGYLLFHEMQL